MLHSTIEATKALLKADTSLTPTARKRILAVLINDGQENPLRCTPEPRLIRRKEVARRMDCSLRAVDNWSKLGILNKIKLPGRIRAAGFREDEVVALINGKGGVL